MKLYLKKIVAACALALAVVAGSAFYVYQNTVRVLVYHTNDMHGWIMAQKVKLPKEDKAELTGGFAALGGYLKDKPRGYLLIDSGDFFQGTPEGDLTRGDSALECMNAFPYTASAIGNHEFDLGAENVRRLAARAKFPFLSANTYNARTGERADFAVPYIVKEIGGVKVAVVGLISSNMKNLVLPKNIEGLRFENETVELKKVMEELKAQDVKIVIVAAHVGIETKDSPPDFEGEKFLAAQVPGIHLILGGHTHFSLDRPYEDPRNKTLIVHNQSGLKTVTRTMLRVWKKSGKLFSHSFKLVPLKPDQTGEDPELKKIVESYQKKVGEQLDVVVGRSQTALDKKGIETLLGNWKTDVMRQFAGSDIAFQNIGGIRADLPEGALTLRHLYLLSPFGNTIVTMNLDGAQVKEVLEHSVSGSQGVMQVSGLKMVYDPSLPKGSRVSGVTVNGKPLDLKKMYRVATNNFVAFGGDGYSAFKQAKNVKDTLATDREIETDCVKKHSPISAKIEGRILKK